MNGPHETDAIAPRLRNASAVLMYPFRHRIVGPRRHRPLEALARRWRPWWARFEDDQALLTTVDDTYFCLPYVRSLIDPETERLDRGPDEAVLRQAHEVASLGPAALARQLPTYSVLRLTLALDKDPVWSRTTLEFRLGDDEFQAPFRVHWVDLALFPQAVGFLMLKVSLAEETPTFDRFRDFLSLARLIHPPRVGWRLANWRFGGPGDDLVLSARDVVDYLTQGLTDNDTPISSGLTGFASQLPTLPESRRYSGTSPGMTYGDSFRLHTYACLATDPDDAGPPPEPFETVGELLLYELATCTDTTQPDYRPDPGYYRTLRQRGEIALWDNWKGLALHDNVAFLGLDSDSGFLARALPHNVENDYLKLHMLARYQKARLLVMFGELIQREEDPLVHIAQARRLWRSFQQFQNAYWFLEVTRKPIPTEIYQRLQAGMGTPAMYQEMLEQVRELHSHYDRVFNQQLGFLINLFVLLGIPVGIAASLFGNLMVQHPGTYWGPFTALIAVLMLGLVGSWVVWRFDLFHVDRWGSRLRRWFRGDRET